MLLQPTHIIWRQCQYSTDQTTKGYVALVVHLCFDGNSHVGDVRNCSTGRYLPRKQWGEQGECLTTLYFNRSQKTFFARPFFDEVEKGREIYQTCWNYFPISELPTRIAELSALRDQALKTRKWAELGKHADFLKVLESALPQQ